MDMDALSKKFAQYVTAEIEKNEYAYLSEDADFLNIIRNATECTVDYKITYEKYKALGISTDTLTKNWLSDVKPSIEMMQHFDFVAESETKLTIFDINSDIETNTETQAKFQENLKTLKDLFKVRLQKKLENKTEEQEVDYLKKKESNEDFLFTYYEQQYDRIRDLQDDKSYKNPISKNSTQQNTGSKQNTDKPEPEQEHTISLNDMNNTFSQNLIDKINSVKKAQENAKNNQNINTQHKDNNDDKDER